MSSHLLKSAHIGLRFRNMMSNHANTEEPSFVDGFDEFQSTSQSSILIFALNKMSFRILFKL